MKRLVWLNKSNGQLCATIPKNSGVKEGDIVNVEKEKVKTIVYSPITADLFHYGYLRLLENANELGNFHIVGILTDEAVNSYRKGSVTNFKERMAIISALRCVDMVIAQNKVDPTENLRKIHEQFKNAKIIMVFGSNWKNVPGKRFLKEINGEIIQPPFYEKLSNKKIAGKIVEIYGE